MRGWGSQRWNRAGGGTPRARGQGGGPGRQERRGGAGRSGAQRAAEDPGEPSRGKRLLWSQKVVLGAAGSLMTSGCWDREEIR